MKNGYPNTARVLLALGLLAGIVASQPLFAQNSLTVLDPRRNWETDQGTIEEAVFSVHPKGVYMEVGMYLTFSARGSIFANRGNIETVLHFTLPEEAIVTDSWLWVNDIIIRADIKDVWTATGIYEGIVNRRQDPSILYKRGPGRYELRIFPMGAGQTRKVKITYQIPALWTAGSVSAPMVTELLQTSRIPVPSVTVLAWPDAPWRNPRLVEEPGREFVARDGNLGPFFETTVPGTALPSTLTLALDSPLRNGLFLSRIPVGEETWYQLALLPSDALGLTASRKVAVLFDYDVAKTNLSQAEIIDAARTLLQTSLAPADSFTLILSDLEIRRLSETWVPANTASIEAAFAALGPNPMSDYSNLPTLLANGINFIDQNGTGGSILLLSSADQVGEAEVANRLIDDLRAATGGLPPIHVVDYTNRNFSTHFFAGQVFQGNGFFYNSLARLSGGTYLNVRDGSAAFSEVLATSFTALGGTISAFDLFTTLRFGFCFNRFTANGIGDAAFVDQAILQVGRCIGGFPFQIEASGVFNAAPFSRSLRINEQNAGLSDTTLVSHWSGRRIFELENGPQSNDAINEILDLSLDQRVLSFYTAFLALEPSQGGEECAECRDETTEATDIEDELPLPDEVILDAYPNPFHTTVTIAVTLPEPVAVGEVTFEIYDVMGRVVKTLRPNASGFLTEFTLTWDGTNDAGQQVSSGTYFFVMVTPQGRYTISLVRVR